jgi:hypothetical protein
MALAVFLALPGCVSPPDWAYFDTERHPIGAYPAQAGFYVGAYAVYPVIYLFAGVVGILAEDPGPGLPEESGMEFLGIVVGVPLGAPFHYIALPFRSVEDRAEHADTDPEPVSSRRE